MKRNKYANSLGKKKNEARKKKSLCVSSTVSYWSQIFGLPDLKRGARVAEHKSAPVPRQRREEKKRKGKKKSRSSLYPPKKNQLKKKKERPSDPTTKSHGFLPLQLSITGEVVNVVNE